MEFTDGALCLNDIRSMRLAINDLLKWVKTVCPKTGELLAVPSMLSQSTATVLKTEMTSTQVFRLLSTTTVPTQTPDTDSSTEPLIPLPLETVEPELIVAPALHPDIAALVVLCASLLGAWLAMVVLSLTWMRLVDLRYRPAVVSILLKMFFDPSVI
jgi:hypothetical protein